MKSITLIISHESVMDRIYALSALRSFSNAPDQPGLPLLTRGEAPALKLVIKDLFATWICRVAHWVEDFDLDSDQHMAVTIIPPADAPAVIRALRHDIERMLAFKAMAIALTGDEADEYEATAVALTRDITLTLAGRSVGPVIPHWL